MCDGAVAHRDVIAVAQGAAVRKTGSPRLESIEIEPPSGLRCVAVSRYRRWSGGCPDREV